MQCSSVIVFRWQVLLFALLPVLCVLYLCSDLVMKLIKVFLTVFVVAFVCVAIISLVHAWNGIDLTSSAYTNLMKLDHRFNSKELPKSIGKCW